MFNACIACSFCMLMLITKGKKMFTACLVQTNFRLEEMEQAAANLSVHPAAHSPFDLVCDHLSKTPRLIT